MSANHLNALRAQVAERTQEVEKSRERLDAILNSSLDGIVVFEAVRDKTGALQDLRFVLVNSAAKKMMRESDSSLLGQHLCEKFPIVTTDGLYEKYARIVEEGVAMDFEYQSLRGEIPRWFRVAGVKLGDGLVLSYAEITARKQAEEQIKTSARRLSLATQAMQAGIWDWDVRSNDIVWDEKMYEIYGLPENVPVDYKVWASSVIPEDLPHAEAILQSVIASKSQGSAEFRITHPNGSIRHIQAAEGVIMDDAGRVTRVVGVNIDVTERKKLEKQFLRAQRMESIGTMAGGIAHDLNNILAPILMSIDLLKSMSEKPEATGILETIEASAKRGADIVRQVLSFARGMEGERIEVQPNHLLKELENIIKETFPKNIRLQFSIPKDTWTILGDPTQIYQILLNLCVNARDAMPDGGSLSLSIQNCALDEQCVAMDSQAKAGKFVSIIVIDTGTGMPPDIVDKIFEPFFTTKVLTKGTGLGLSTVMAIVKSHEGIVKVYSEPGKGTTFKVYLPAMEGSSKANSEPKDQASLLRGTGEMILVIEDEAPIRTITAQTLEAYGYRVLTASDGAEGLATYAQHQNEIAVVLTDMNMPVMDGRATIHALMRVNPGVKIIAASGLNTNESVAKASGAGAKFFLTKPYSAEPLLKTMRAILDEVKA